MTTLLGKTFPITILNIGNLIETMLGGIVSPSHDADLGVWEVKSRKIDAKAWITLGGKKTDNGRDVLEQVYNKIKHVIFVEYEVNVDTTFTVVKITFMYNLDRDTLNNVYGILVKPETRHGITYLKVSRNSISKLYGRVVEYKVKET